MDEAKTLHSKCYTVSLKNTVSIERYLMPWGVELFEFDLCVGSGYLMSSPTAAVSLLRGQASFPSVIIKKGFIKRFNTAGSNIVIQLVVIISFLLSTISMKRQNVLDGM